MAARNAAPTPRRPSSGPTHFLCIPLQRRQLARSITAFRAAVTDINSFALPADAIRPPGTMHLTLGVMSLPQQAQIDRAVSLLRHLKLRDVLAEARASLLERRATTTAAAAHHQHQPMVISLQGLHAMQDPAKSSVLYAPPLDVGVDSSGVLYTFCKAVKAAFVEAGIMEAEGSRPLLLHATVVNTIYVKGRNGQRRRERLMLDARDLLGAYEDHVWLDQHEVRSVALCRMGAQPVGRDGDQAYEVVAEVRI